MIADTLGYLIDKMVHFKNELIAASSEYEYFFTRHLVRNLQQVNDNYFSVTHNLTYVRDKYMAENALWISELFGDDVKVAVWAHNGHVGTRGIESRGMGSFLEKELGEEYNVIGFELSTGTVTANGYNPSTDEYTSVGIHRFDNPPKEGSIVELFHAAKYENFILNLNELPKYSNLSNWLSSWQYFKAIGAAFNPNSDHYFPAQIKSWYNVMIYFDHTRHTDRTGFKNESDLSMSVHQLALPMIK